MDKNLSDFLEGNTNIVNLDVILSKELAPNGSEHIRMLWKDHLLYEFWYNPIKRDKGDKPPKNTGGKKPYVMLMIGELKKLKNSEHKIKNLNEVIGCLTILSEFIEWNTGRLINKRSKKSLKYDDLLRELGYGENKFRGILKTLKDNDLLINKSEGYFISNRLIKKGSKNKDTL